MSDTYPIIDAWCNLFTPSSMKKNFIDNPEMAHVVGLWHMSGRTRGWTPAEFAQHITAESRKWAKVIEDAKIQVK